MNIIKNLIRGNKIFRKYHFPDFKEEIDELIKNGQNGYLVSSDDDFVKCINSLNSKQIAKISKNSLNARKKYNSKSISKEVENIYKEVIS